jgi:hypothetical protein
MGLGALMGLGGAPEGGGEGDPEALLSQIIDLMGQYLALGPDTPAAQVISDAMPAIEEAMGGGMMPPEGEVGPATADPSAGVEPEMPEDDPMSMAPESAPSSFEDASAMALADMKKRKPKA